MKVLIVRVGAMGDVLHALPAVAALHRERPDWRIDWAVDERWAPLLLDRLRQGPVVQAIHRVPVRAWGRSPLSPGTIGSIRTLRRAMRQVEYDLAVDMQGTIRSGVIGWLAHAKNFAGYDDPRERAAKRLYGVRISRNGKHVVEQGRSLLSEAAGVPLTLSPEDQLLPVDAVAEAWADDIAAREQGPFCVMSPRAGWGAKQWPAGHFGALATELGRMGIRTMVNAAEATDSVAAEVVAASGGAATVVACGVAELASLLRRAKLFVGGDSGPTHMAALLGTPLVGLYGPTDPARNGPWGAGPQRVLRHGSSQTSHKKVEVIDRGLGQITVEEALASAQELLR